MLGAVMTRTRRGAAMGAVLLATIGAGVLGGCEQQASDTTTYGRLTQLDPPCIARPGQTQACFEAPKEQLTTVEKGDCVEVRSRPSRGGGLPPVLSIRPIPPSSASGACDTAGSGTGSGSAG